MAVGALQTLSKDHIWVLKATLKKEELKEKVKKDYVWALKTIIKSFGNSCDIKRIKAELTPALLSSGEWPAWSAKARDILKSNPDFGVSPDNIDIFTVRDRPISVTEKLYNEFNAQKNFFEKASTIRIFVNNLETDPNSEYFSDMFAYFASFLRSSSQAPELTVASYLIIKEVAARDKYAHLGSILTIGFADLFMSITDVPSLFKNLKDAKFKEEFLHNIKIFIDGWPDIYVELFPFALMPSIVSQLEKGHAEKLTAMCVGCFEHFRDNRDAVVWLYKYSRDAEWYKAANISFEKQLITLINILDITYRDIENHKDTAENRKINKMAYVILFKEGSLGSFIDSADEDAIIRIYTFINDVKDLDPQDKMNLRGKVLEKHPSFKFFGDAERKISRALIVTQAKYEEKQKQLAHIMGEEVPANSKDIEYALSLGDLRENAEYKAAKEKQEHLNTQIAKLKEDIDRAQLFDPHSINTSRVSFGTKVILFNETKNQQEEYTVLGPWESDPENNIISYLSPFGNMILNKTVDEKFEFAINNERVSYLVKEILPADV
jgi:transcription elongation factor GreA